MPDVVMDTAKLVRCPLRNGAAIAGLLMSAEAAVAQSSDNAAAPRRQSRRDGFLSLADNRTPRISHPQGDDATRFVAFCTHS